MQQALRSPSYSATAWSSACHLGESGPWLATGWVGFRPQLLGPGLYCLFSLGQQGPQSTESLGDVEPPPQGAHMPSPHATLLRSPTTSLGPYFCRSLRGSRLWGAAFWSAPTPLRALRSPGSPGNASQAGADLSPATCLPGTSPHGRCTPWPSHGPHLWATDQQRRISSVAPGPSDSDASWAGQPCGFSKETLTAEAAGV